MTTIQNFAEQYAAKWFADGHGLKYVSDELIRDAFKDCAIKPPADLYPAIREKIQAEQRKRLGVKRLTRTVTRTAKGTNYVNLAIDGGDSITVRAASNGLTYVYVNSGLAAELRS